MHIRSLVLVLSATLVGCGIPLPFVNFAAQVSLKSVEPATVTVSYTKDATNQVTASFKNPVVTLEGAPGSVGALFTSMELTALDPGNPANLLPLFANSQNRAIVPITLRVATSALREDPRAGTVNPVGQDQQKIVLGQGKAELPVVSNGILEHGKTRTNGPLTVSARLSGKDDAQWPLSLEVLVPVAFSGGN
ncbi:MAG: hypothetical protein VKO21_03840 [Candidatus Sericytochromatia bacterium]|nr:hypothetical protein [Candidatus Sericytochromatia bacterium]